MDRIRSSRFLLGVCLLARFFKWVAAAVGVVAVLCDISFSHILKRGFDHRLLVPAGIEFACALALWACEKHLLNKYRRMT